MTGRDLGWELESAAIRRWLGAALDRDDDERAARAMSPRAVELKFGDDDEHPSAEVGLPDGRRLRFRGMVDRVDQAADGSLLVLDYKTGKGRRTSPWTTTGWTGAASSSSPSTPMPPAVPSVPTARPKRVDAYYWFVEESGRKAWRGGPVDEPVQERFEAVVGTDRRGHRVGRLPGQPRRGGLVRAHPLRVLRLQPGVPEQPGRPLGGRPRRRRAGRLPASWPRGSSRERRRSTPRDQAARERIRTDHESTLFVEAGAGTGKTTALVRRVAELVVTGRVTSARELAAITFTEAAAAELRDRGPRAAGAGRPAHRPVRRGAGTGRGRPGRRGRDHPHHAARLRQPAAGGVPARGGPAARLRGGGRDRGVGPLRPPAGGTCSTTSTRTPTCAGSSPAAWPCACRSLAWPRWRRSSTTTGTDSGPAAWSAP